MTYTYFDIETIPNQSVGALHDAKLSVKVPANYKDPDTIERYKEEKAQEALDKTALDGFKGHVACISSFQNGSFVSHSVTDLKEEKEAIERFFASLSGLRLVGHNISGFDIPFLTRRALVLGVSLPSDFVWPRNPKPWDQSIFDTMTVFGMKDFIGLSALSKALGFEGKGTVDGSMVSQMWKDGLHKEIAEYCEDDVNLVKQVHERFLSVGW